MARINGVCWRWTDPRAGSPDATNAAIAWVHPRQGNYMQTPIVVSNRVYGCTDSGVLTCFDADNGNIIYSE
ncbi:MAG TPA: PQQ-binding-like beta-propeller repeat protein, partial [Methylomirabilota bacterium]|nr:PQQ-binding-like beta-propeller repeat protein [Methylomirabilota bacterium]